MKGKKNIAGKRKSKAPISRDVLTKTVLEKAARKGIREAVATTVEVMGFNVVALDGWIVKKYPDNRIEKNLSDPSTY